MPEVVNIRLNNAEAFAEAVHGGLPEGGDLSIITRDDVTVDTHRAMACLTFSVEVNGELKRAQTVTSVRNLKVLLRILDARYDDEGRPRRDVPAA